jgi:hypothetical protein
MLQLAAGTDFGVYEPRNPNAGHYYRCVAKHFEELEAVWDDQYSRLYGFWRPYVMEVIYRYLDCGDLHFGFARVNCKDCGHEYLNFHPHLNVLATDGCFYNDGAFMVCPPPKTADLEELFRHEVFKMLEAEGKITDSVIENMINWRHSGFNVYCGILACGRAETMILPPERSHIFLNSPTMSTILKFRPMITGSNSLNSSFRSHRKSTPKFG